MPDWFEQALGTVLVLVTLCDVFLTVLYARAGAGIFAIRLARATWAAFRAGAGACGLWGDRALTFCGPAILVLLVAVWALALTLGAALVMHPLLGTAITAQGGSTPADFVAAMYAGGSSMAIVGSSDFAPQTSWSRILYLTNSLIGMSVVSLTLTYIMQVYAALQRRNALGLKLHLLTAETGDAAELVARLGPYGQFSAGYSDLADIGSGMAQTKEAHHFYPLLFYFRFQQPFYSVSRSALVALDAVTLIRTALDDQRHGWLKDSAAVEQLWRASLILVSTLEEALHRGDAREQPRLPGETPDRWRRRYRSALQRLRRAGIEVTADENAGEEAYISLRSCWDPLIAGLAPAMAYHMDQIDPAGGYRCGEPERRQCG
ncbi:two pore domain potassium channel family protein [Roseomonas populi]|uniref:Two pore domain potassium channel family protein n=1 Tax=Roseomonas populi TaxID=3121582 RepID=A0ABT1X9Z6_9PROT|nr:two pore domain potassium channel family protein [Roseomonas pecuniae]MCR0984930.1 two pore domain potassium channel family protein [Roseomonas pecuniae]